MRARPKSTLRKESDLEPQNAHLVLNISGFLASLESLFRNPVYRSYPFKGSCVSPEFQRTGLSQKNLLRSLPHYFTWWRSSYITRKRKWGSSLPQEPETSSHSSPNMPLSSTWVIFSHLDTFTQKGWILIIHISGVRGKEINIIHSQFTIYLVISSSYDLSLCVGTPFAPILGMRWE